ncbi:MAG: outer membrane beta-barrel protein [Desulfobacteraceae bacterium]|nr:outer membrane beta-barrel protein [Desulfobacteraceae bacterium]
MVFFRTCMIILVAGLLPLPLNAIADPLKFVPAVRVKQEYNDNILFEHSMEDEDFITTVSPSFTVDQKVERLQANLKAGVDKIIYWEFDELDALDMDVDGKVRFQATERLGFGVKGRYAEDSRRDRETDLTGLVLAGDRDATNISLFSDYLVSEKTKASLTLSYSDVTIEKPDDEENEYYKVDLAFTHNISKWFDNTTGLLNFSYMNYDSDDRNLYSDNPWPGLTTKVNQAYAFDLWQMYAGFSKNITELFSVYLQAGAGYTRSDESARKRYFETGTGNELTAPTRTSSSDSNFNGVLVAGMDYTGLYYTAGLSVSHDARGSSGVNGLVERTSVSANYSRKISSELTATLSGACHLNRTDRSIGADEDDLTCSVRTGLRYKFSRDFTLSAYYRYRTLNEREEDTHRYQNLVYLMVNKTFEL